MRPPFQCLSVQFESLISFVEGGRMVCMYYLELRLQKPVFSRSVLTPRSSSSKNPMMHMLDHTWPLTRLPKHGLRMR